MNIVTQVILPIGLAFIMFAMGITLTVADFKQIFKFPRAFLIGFGLQMFSLPLLAFGLTWLWFSWGGLGADFAVGMIILAACPGGITSNILVHLSKGDTALSISLTAVISMLSMLSIPLIVNLGLRLFQGADAYVALPMLTTSLGICLMTTVPVLLGMACRQRFSDWTIRHEKQITRAASGVFFCIATAALLKDIRLVLANLLQVGGLALSLNLATMGLAYLIARISRFDLTQRIAIIYECGLQNSTLAIFVALTLLKNEAMMISGVVYSFLMILSVVMLIGYFRRAVMQSKPAETAVER